MDSVKPKILVYGHSWVRSMGRLHDTLDLSNLIVHYEGRPGATIERLCTDLTNVLAEENYSHMLLFTLIAEMYLSENMADKRHNKDYWVTYPNITFSLDKIVESLDKFSKLCGDLKPDLKVHLMIPPPLDLNHYNEIQLRDAPPDVIKAYHHNPKYKKYHLANNVLHMHSQIRMLGKMQFHWNKKRIFVIQNAIDEIQIACVKNAMHSFFQKEVPTMGKDSYLIDGYHPSSLLVSKIWKRLMDTGMFVMKKRKIQEPLVMKVAPLTEDLTPQMEDTNTSTSSSTTQQFEEQNQLTSTTTDNLKPNAQYSASPDTETHASPNKKMKLTDNNALDEFVAAETERLIYYIYGYTAGKGLNYTTNDVAALISKYISNRE